MELENNPESLQNYLRWIYENPPDGEYINETECIFEGILYAEAREHPNRSDMRSLLVGLDVEGLYEILFDECAGRVVAKRLKPTSADKELYDNMSHGHENDENDEHGLRSDYMYYCHRAASFFLHWYYDL